ncbi:MAG: response regulator [Bacteroidota bacterium]
MTENKTILIVDDETDVISYLTVLLKDHGFDVITARNGKEAFETAKEKMPDLITLDITMPQESGVRAFRDLQEEPSTKEIPIIIITGVSGEFKGFIEKRKKVHPPVAYFEKPINRDELIAKIREILNPG